MLELGKKRHKASQRHSRWQLAEGLLVELLSIEQPQVEAVLHLMNMPHRGGHKPACGVPLNVCAHEVLCCAHGLEVVSIEELKLPIHALHAHKRYQGRAGWNCNLPDTPHSLIGCDLGRATQSSRGQG